MTTSLIALFVAFIFLFPATGHAEISIQKDVSYLGEARSEKVDIYTRAGSVTSHPAILLIHGGGWIGGDKADKRGISISSELAEQGYIVFAINYRLASKNDPPAIPGAFPQNIFDCKSALRFMRANASRYHVDPKRIAVMGESAGGHLALLLGATGHISDLNQNGLFLDQSSEVTCIVDMYGLPDLLDKTIPYIEAPFRGQAEAQTEANLHRANPMEYLNKTTPPILILHGTADTVVPIDQSRRLAAKLKVLGVSYQYVEIPGAPHSFNLHPEQMDLRPIVFAFLAKYLHP